MGETKRDKVLTVEESAKIRGVCREAIVTAIRKKTLKATFFHGEWHIRESSLKKYELQDESSSDEFVSLDEAVNVSKISRVLILRSILRGTLKAKTTKGSSNYMIKLSDLRDWEREKLAAKEFRH